MSAEVRPRTHCHALYGGRLDASSPTSGPFFDIQEVSAEDVVSHRVCDPVTFHFEKPPSRSIVAIEMTVDF